MFGKKRQAQREWNNGIRNQGSRQELHLRKKATDNGIRG
jgi:hypothetical protein